MVSLGSFTIYWYGVFYVVAFALAYVLLGRLPRWRGLVLDRAQRLELIAWGAVGTVLGGRLGYVLLYEPLYYLAHPLEIVQLAQGGMSSHGGFIGVAVALWFFALQMKRGWLSGTALAERNSEGPQPIAGLGEAELSEDREGPGETGPASRYLQVLDIVIVPAALGLALGRLGNVINQELYITPLAQLVAIAAPLLVAAVCYWHLTHRAAPGTTVGLFLVLYSVARLGEELLRESEWPLIAEVVTRGQLYTLPFLLAGLYLLKDEVNHSRSR